MGGGDLRTPASGTTSRKIEAGGVTAQQPALYVRVTRHEGSRRGKRLRNGWSPSDTPRDLREDNSVSWDASISAAGGVQAGAREFRHTPSDDRVRRQMPVGETTRRRSWRRSSSSTSGSIVCTISCPVYGDCCPQTLDVPIVPVAIRKKQNPA